MIYLSENNKKNQKHVKSAKFWPKSFFSAEFGGFRPFFWKLFGTQHQCNSCYFLKIKSIKKSKPKKLKSKSKK
jgi:hypothetical protein